MHAERLQRWFFSSLVMLALGWHSALAANAGGIDEALDATIQVYRMDGAESALAEFERLAEAYRERGDALQELRARRYVAECHWRLGNFDRSRAELAAAMSQAEALDARRELGDLNNVLGLLNWDSGQFEAALQAFERARSIAESLDDLRLQAMALNNSSLVLDETGEYTLAREQYQSALAIYREIGFERGMGDTLGNLGGTYLLLGHYSEALNYYHQALQVSERLNSATSLSQDHGNIAQCLLGMGRIAEALTHFDRAIAYAKQAGMSLDVAYWSASKGSALMDSGRYDLGLAYFREAMEQYERIGARTERVETQLELGQLLVTLGDDVAAESQFEAALAESRDMPFDRGITMSLMSLGMLDTRRAQWDQAAARFGQVIERSRQSGQQSVLTRGLLRLARVELQRGHVQAAHVRIQEALKSAQEIGARPLSAEAHYLAGEYLRLQHEPLQALVSYDTALDTAAGAASPELQWQIHHGRAQALESRGQLAQAVEALQAAVIIIENVRSRLLESRYQSGYVQDKYEVYVELVRLQLELGQREQAFEMAERLRSRSFSRLAQPARDQSLSARDQALREELRARIRHLQQLLEEEQTLGAPMQRQAAIDSFSRELVQAEQAYLEFLDNRGMLAGQSRAGEKQSGTGAVRERLRPGEALVEYVLAKEQVLVFVMRRDGFHTLTHPVTRRNLESRIGLLRDLVQQPEHERWRDPAGSLAAALVQPIVEQRWLEGVSTLYVVPHGVLNYLPFSLLPMPGSDALLVQRVNLTYLPSAHMLADLTGQPGPARQLLSVAPERSGLVYAAEEARSVGELFEPEAELLMGSEATESRFKALAGDYRFLHLATHGYFDRVNPLFSWLELEPDESNDGHLEVHEILELRLDAQLITLSACQTALAGGLVADLPAGDEFVGLTRAFLSSGGRSVLATLWEVDDRSSVRLMRHFYRDLAQNPVADRHAALLSAAQRQLMLHPQTQHPYYWAPFVLVGDAHEDPAPENSDSEV